MNLRSPNLLVGIILAVALAGVGFFLLSSDDKSQKTLPSNEVSTPSNSVGFVHSGEALRLEILAGSSVRYLVGEQLARRDLPNDAIGVTSDITGDIFLGKSGKIDKNNSKIIVKLGSLESDDSRRDNYLKQEH